MQLYGFTYDRISLDSPRSIEARLNWLGRLKRFSAQPYQQFARVLRSEGNHWGAQRVLLKMEDERRRNENLSIWQRGWGYFLKFTVGYGYRPTQPALTWLAILVVLGTSLYWSAYARGSMVPTDSEAYSRFMAGHVSPAYYGEFHAFAYSLENTFQLVRLGESEKWRPIGTALWPMPNGLASSIGAAVFSSRCLTWFRWFQIIAGWFFTTLTVGGLADVVRKN